MKRYWNWAVSQWDRVIGWSCVAGGAVLTVTGALNVSAAQDQLDQLSYLATGPALGLFLLGVGAILIVTADLRDDWAKLDEIAAGLGSRQDAGGGTPPPSGLTVEITLPETPASSLRVGLPVLAVAGIGILVAAAGASRSLERASAVRWTQLSAASLALALVAVVVCYLRGRETITRGIATVSSGALGTAPTMNAAAGQWYVVDGSQRFHAAGCDLLRFSEARPVPPAEADRAGLTRCPLCR